MFGIGPIELVVIALIGLLLVVLVIGLIRRLGKK